MVSFTDVTFGWGGGAVVETTDQFLKVRPKRFQGRCFICRPHPFYMRQRQTTVLWTLKHYEKPGCLVYNQSCWKNLQVSICKGFVE